MRASTALRHFIKKLSPNARCCDHGRDPDKLPLRARRLLRNAGLLLPAAVGNGVARWIGLLATGTRVNQLAGLWRDTWWVWLLFVAITLTLGVLVGWFFFLLVACLPVPYVYFAFNRYDEQGNEKADL